MLNDKNEMEYNTNFNNRLIKSSLRDKICPTCCQLKKGVTVSEIDITSIKPFRTLSR